MPASKVAMTAAHLEASTALYASNNSVRPALRLGVIGCAIGRSRYHAALQAGPGLHVAGLTDSDDRYTRVWARELGSRVPAYASIDALLAHADTFDALLVASPLAERAAHLRAALNIGKPILCECPFAPTLTETANFAQQAQTANVLLMPALPRRFDAFFTAASQHIQSGALGEVKQIRCHWSFPVENVDVTADVVTGGWNATIQTLGSQTADVCRWWQGNGVTVSGDVDLEELRGGKRPGGRLPSERALANLIVTHEHGQSTHHLSRTRAIQPDERYLFSGSLGNMELIVSAGAAGTTTSAPLLRVQKTGQKFHSVSIAKALSPALAPLSPASDRVFRLLRHFADCIQLDAAPHITPADARAALEIVHAAYLSTFERAKISLPLRRDPDVRQMLLPPDPSLPALPG